MSNFGGGLNGLFNSKSVVSNLLIINIIGFVGAWIFGNVPGTGISTTDALLGLYIPGSESFRPWQLLTHMFLHGNLMHIFFNMYALFLFGSVLEQVWGPKRFLIFYLVCGFGAALIHMGVSIWEAEALRNEILNLDLGITEESLRALKAGDTSLKFPTQGNAMELLRSYYAKFNYPTVGASGAVFGLLLGYGMLFPNNKLYMLFFPVGIPAKWFVIIYGAIELFMGINNNPGDNVAHFAHLGGMIFGFFLIKYWKKDRQNFY